MRFARGGDLGRSCENGVLPSATEQIPTKDASFANITNSRRNRE